MNLEHEPNEEEQYIDHLIYSHWMGAKELHDNIDKIPHDYIVSAISEIDDAIRLLALSKMILENKKQ